MLNNELHLFVFEGVRAESKYIDMLEQNFLGRRISVKCVKENQSPAAEFNVGLVTAFSAIVREPVDSETMQKNMQKALEERGITITDLQMDILVYFYLHPTATRNDYISSDKKLSEGGTISSITRLQELELLKRKGGKKNGEWIVAIDI